MAVWISMPSARKIGMRMKAAPTPAMDISRVSASVITPATSAVIGCSGCEREAAARRARGASALAATTGPAYAAFARKASAQGMQTRSSPTKRP